MTSQDSALDPVTLEVWWGRLLAALDEAELGLIRTSFSLIVREAFDFACVLLDCEGNSVGQSWRSQPSFVGTLPVTLRHALERIPLADWRPGDVVATNDPWMGTGHLPDLSMLTPIFFRGRLTGFFGTVAHKPDMGGTIWSADCREVFEEGLCLPILRLYREGKPNQAVLDIIAHNVRVPEQVLGDIHAQMVASEVGTQRLLELFQEIGLDEPTPLFRAIVARTEAAMRRGISLIPDGQYTYRFTMDGREEPLTLHVTLTVQGEEMVVDYTGTSPQIQYGINDPYVHSFAYTVYPIKCVLDPFTPNNSGAFRPIQVTAPEGCLVNPRFPAPVSSRQMTGHCIAIAVMGALAKAVPERVMAEAGAPACRAVLTGIDQRGQRWTQLLLTSGGMGATAGKDGLSATPYPTNSVFPSSEAVEAMNPLLFLEKALVTDSGGPGRQRGGLGQRITVKLLSPSPSTVSLMMDRIHHQPQGLQGGLHGGAAGAYLGGAQQLNPKGRTVVQPGDVVTIVTPGGGGYGPPEERPLEAVQEDLQEGYISLEGAEAAYQWSHRKAQHEAAGGSGP